MLYNLILTLFLLFWRAPPTPRCFDSRPVRAYTHNNGFRPSIPTIVWLPHELGRDADACHSQHHHRLHRRVPAANAAEAIFSPGCDVLVSKRVRPGAAGRHAWAAVLAASDQIG